MSPRTEVHERREAAVLPAAGPPVPPLPPDPEALFAEARRHRRRRRFRNLAIVLVLVAAAAAAYGAVDSRSKDASLGGGGGRLAAAAPYATVVLAVDVSGSMRATDIGPTRLDAAVAALGGLVGRLPGGVEVGVISFGNSAAVVQPPTRSRRLVLEALRSLRPEAGTALGGGLARAVRSAQASLARQGLHREPGRFARAAIVLVSDGAQNRGQVTPQQAARAAKAAGIRVDAIALGTANGAVSFGFGGSTTSVPVPPDPRITKQIATATGGRSFRGGDSGELTRAVRTIGSLLEKQ